MTLQWAASSAQVHKHGRVEVEGSPHGLLHLVVLLPFPKFTVVLTLPTGCQHPH